MWEESGENRAFGVFWDLIFCVAFLRVLLYLCFFCFSASVASMKTVDVYQVKRYATTVCHTDESITHKLLK